MSYSKTMQGELEAKDAFSVVMVEQRMNMSWSYDGSGVWGGSKTLLTPNYDAFWYWVGPKISSGPTYIATPYDHYYAWYYDKHKSDGFPFSWLPDTYFEGMIELEGYESGAGICDFSWSWTNQYTGTHADPTCHPNI